MRLGSETGSLVNHIIAGAAQPAPFAGMPATLCSWSDRAAATVSRVWTEGSAKRRFIAVQADNAKVIAGSTQDGSAQYEYSRNPDAYESIYRQEAGGAWVQVIKSESGRWKISKNGALALGYRESYRDPSF